MLNIVHITSMHDWNDDRIYERACVGSARLGHKVTLIAQKDKNEIVDDVNIIALKQLNGLKRRILSSFEAFKHALNLKNTDIYQFHDPDLMIFMVLLKWISGKKVIYDIHENYSSRITNSSLSPFIKKIALFFFRNIENYCIKQFSAIVTVSGAMKTLFEKLNIPIQVLSNSVDIERLKDIDITLPKFNPPVLYTSGTNNKERNGTKAVEALPLINEKFPNLKVMFVGRYTNNYDLKLNELAKTLDVDKNLITDGMQPWRENFNRTVKANIGFVFCEDTPNSRVAIPNRIFEYMYCGVPVIVESFPELKRIVEESECGFAVNSNNPEEIAEATIKILSNPELANKMAKNGRKAVIEKYSFNAELDKLILFYQYI
jgi:glycosyltransferase involved in cell wall biosynthesis